MSFDASKVEKLSDFRDKFRDFSTYDEEFVSKIHPLFVSRMPKRSAKGKAHKETIRSPKMTDDKRRLTRKRLSECTLSDIKNSILPVSDKALYEQLVSLWKEKGKDAFAEPVYKNGKTVDKNGNPISPVTTIKVYSVEPSGILINKGTQFVNNGDTVCLNIYRRKEKYFAAPIYVHSLNSKNIEILPTPNGRSAVEKADFDSIRNEDGKIFATEENGFEFVMSVFPNDYVKIYYGDNKITEGYYVKYGIAGGTLSLIEHNNPSKANLDMIHCSVGTAMNIKKMNISVLGDNYIEE